MIVLEVVKRYAYRIAGLRTCRTNDHSFFAGCRHCERVALTLEDIFWLKQQWRFVMGR